MSAKLMSLHEENSRTALAAYGNIQSKVFPQYLATILATLGALAMGMHLSWTSAAIPMLKREDSQVFVTDEEGSWIGSIITLGAFLGAIPTGAITTRIGPKRTLQLIALPFLFTWYLIAFSTNIWGLYAARFLAGLATGSVCVAAPMYVSELAEQKIRGTLGTFFQLQITIGILLAYIFGLFIQDFKTLAFVSSAVPIVFLATFSLMPESPTFLCANGQMKEARKSLQYFRGREFDVDDELEKIADNLRASDGESAGLLDLFANRVDMKAFGICLALMFFQQMSGVNAVLFYAQEIFNTPDSTLSPGASAVVVGAVQVLATYTSSLLIDRAGRKILLIVSAFLMTVCLGIVGFYRYLQEVKQQDVSHISFVPLLSIAIYLIVFSIGFGPIPWMIVGELFTPKLKNVASSVSAAFNWILAFSVTKAFQTMIETFGSSATFSIFAAICFVATLFCISFVPETKGKSVEEIQAILSGEVPMETKEKFTQNIQIADDDDIITIHVKA